MVKKNINFGSKRRKCLISLALPPKNDWFGKTKRTKTKRVVGVNIYIYISLCWELWPFISMAWKSIILDIKLLWIFWLWSATLMAIEILLILCWWCYVASHNCPLFWFISKKWHIYIILLLVEIDRISLFHAPKEKGCKVLLKSLWGCKLNHFLIDFNYATIVHTTFFR